MRRNLNKLRADKVDEMMVEHKKLAKQKKNQGKDQWGRTNTLFGGPGAAAPDEDCNRSSRESDCIVRSASQANVCGGLNVKADVNVHDIERILRKRDFIGPVELIAQQHSDVCAGDFRERLVQQRNQGSQYKKRPTITTKTGF